MVGVGASAGGLEALGRLFAHLPADTGMAFVLVQHLDSHGPSQLPDILSRMTPLPVTEATSGLAVRPNHVYVMPPGSDLTIEQGALQVATRAEGGGLHLPIDRLFRSLAEDRQAWAIGVVLSGDGSDGALGSCEIKSVGGITFAQDQETAQHPDMPRYAVDSGAVDFVLTPEAIAERLAAIGGHPLFGAGGRAPAVDEAQDDADFSVILGVVRAAAGVDFTHYRDSTLRRRIRRRIALRSSRSVADYVRLLKADRTEVRALYQELLITVTAFFRDPEVFEAIKRTVFSQLVADRSPTTPLRIWVPGCSTGQEPFSLAMILMEFFDDRPGQLPPIQIFATDICDETVLQKARAGFYPKSIEAEVSPDRLRRFFTKENGAYRIDKSIRDVCVFARQDVTADPPFSHLDLISCRNVLIYFAAPLQKRVLPLFHYALNEGGFLVLGTAESVGEHTDLFGVADRNRKIFAKKTPGARRVVDFMRGLPLTARVRRQGPSEPAPVDFQREADRLLLRHYAPPGVLVDENFDIVQFRGRTGPYIEPPPGDPTTNLFKMVREGLFTDLRSALAEVVESERPARREGVRLSKNGDSRVIGLEVIPVKSVATEVRCFLVLFHEAQPPLANPLAGGQAEAAVAPVAAAREVGVDEVGAAPDPEESGEALRLRQELAATKEYLQSLMEQQDATNEELRSANEEVSSSNEELQSINEELETAKEELQSTNEELKTVNEQIEHRNRELNAVNNDLVNLLSSTHIPIIMVGRDLRIRRFTDSAKRALNLATTDAGRPIRDTHPVVRV
ncbi:MAG TPA: chemotaxis protein CheB, partial [Limnochordia bacterium]|nr:chemotaxis protein CheB [Limnochordia bacterium]